MFEWMNRHKKDIMKYTLYLVIPSFVLLYGYGQCAAPQHLRWVATVNDQEILENTWQNIADNLRNQEQNQMQQQPNAPDRSFSEYLDQALQAAIVGNLLEQKAEEWGIETTDAEVARSIQEMEFFRDENGQFSYDRYRSLLAANSISERQFEEDQRSNLTRNKVKAIVSESLVRALPEQQRMDQMENTSVQVEYLAFEPAKYVEEVTPDDAGLAQFFEKNKEDFKVPEQRRIQYARFHPSNYVQEVAYTTRELTRFFDKSRQSYEIPEKIRLQYITFQGQNFVDQVQVAEEEIQKHYEANQASYVQPEQMRVRYIQQPLALLTPQQAVTDQEVEDYYKANESRYEHGDQAKARHILLRTPPNSPEEQLQAVKDRIQNIRDEIAQGLPFSEAAKQYSEDPGSAARGGELMGYFEKGQMVPQFEEAAFSLPLGQISEPVKSDFGYHLILVEDRKAAGKDTLEMVREEIRGTLQKQKAVQAFRDLASSIQNLDAVQDRYPIQTTDWFPRNVREIPGIPRNEAFVFASAAFGSTSNVVMAGNTFVENLYLIEPVERQPQRNQTLDEAREQVVNDLKQKKAGELAAQAAAADVAEIKNATLELQTIADRRGLQVQVTEPFSRQDQTVPGLGQLNPNLSQTVFALQQGEVGGPVETPQGSLVIRVVAKDPAHLPELKDVQAQVEQDFLRDAAERRARNEANAFSLQVFQSRKPLGEVVAASDVIDWGTTDFFKANEPIPGLGPLRNVNEQTFQLKNKGDVSDAIEERQAPGFNSTPQNQPVEAYYVVQLQEIKDSYLPELEEVREDVERAYRLQLAESIAIEKAQQTLKTIQEKVASGEPLSATRVVDLSAFADQPGPVGGSGAVHRGPVEITGNGQVSGIGRALTLTKTALALKPGQISNVVTNYRLKVTEDQEREQGPLTGVYILQVLDKKEVQPDAQSMSSQFARFMEQTAKRMAVSAWIEEVSASARIEYNPDVLQADGPQDATEALEMTSEQPAENNQKSAS